MENISVMGAAFVTTQIEPELPVGTLVTLVARGVIPVDTDLVTEGHVIRSEVFCTGAGETRLYALGFEQPIKALLPANATAAESVAAEPANVPASPEATG